MKNHSTFIGMDVHKNSIDIAIAQEGRNGQVRHYGKIDVGVWEWGRPLYFYIRL